MSSAKAGSAAKYGSAIAEISKAAQEEVRSGHLTGVTIALVDRQSFFANGFGLADKKRKIPAKPDTVYRAGSISKLFTAVATMQLVEQGRLDLDQPVTNYLPRFRISNPFPDAKPITLRQLMCHRSGMVRESPVGSYFDDSEPGIENTLASLSSCALVYPPGTKTKYSNCGVTVVGAVVQQIGGMAFDQYEQREILTPLGMTKSCFLRTGPIRRRLAIAYMPVAKAAGGFDEIEAPVFELGTIPAGNLYTTAEDLARFLQFLFADGRIGGRQLLGPETLAQMFTPQLTTDTNGFGLGFNIGYFNGHKTVNHMGAVYGFTSMITAVPAERVGIVILCNDDIAVGPVRKLNSMALNLMLSKAENLTDAPPPFTVEVPHLDAFGGDYESQSYWAHLAATNRSLTANISGQKLTLTSVAGLRFEANGRVAYNAPVVFERDGGGAITGFTAFEQKFRRVDASAIPAIPPSWKGLIGAYGPQFIPLIISAKYGHLYAMTENEFDYRLTPFNRFVFNMPPGLYEGEQIVFQTDRSGKVHTAVLANMSLPRR